jgi:steroid 5-alpha reductase family enzyme
MRVAVAYVVAFGAATAWLAWGADTDHLWLDGLIADVIATVVVFGASRWHHNSSFYDAYWSVLPPYLVGYWVLASDGAGDDVRTILVLTVVGLWAVRLTANWVIGFPGLHHEDWRYPMVRDRAGRLELAADFFGIHLVPTFQVFLGLVPAYVAVARPGRDPGWLDAVAVVVGVGAVLLQLVADGQMRRFIRDRREGEAMDRGLWGWSRHPNYFGEISFWCSLGLFGIAASPGDWWWLMVGGAAMLAMFLGASIPMMEGRSLERRPSYQDVIDRVPMLVPRPPRRRAPA